MDNRLFSLMIVPDSGNDVRSSSFNFRLVLSLFSVLVCTFFLCLFFIIGFHIKLNQENEHKLAMQQRNDLLSQIETAKGAISSLSDKLVDIQRNDHAYRQYAYMDVLDPAMYQAGIGGHMIVDESMFIGLQSSMQDDLKAMTLDVKKLDSRVSIQGKSLNEIHAQVLENNEEFNCTPSMLPTMSIRITDDFSYRIHPVTGRRHFHDAVDLAGRKGQKIFSTADGEVVLAKRWGVLGNSVKIKHKYGYTTLYGHLTDVLVEVGQKVKKGEVIGTMGSTGRTTGTHLHYAVIHFNKKVDPKKYF